MVRLKVPVQVTQLLQCTATVAGRDHDASGANTLVRGVLDLTLRQCRVQLPLDSRLLDSRLLHTSYNAHARNACIGHQGRRPDPDQELVPKQEKS